MTWNKNNNQVVKDFPPNLAFVKVEIKGESEVKQDVYGTKEKQISTRQSLPL